MSQENLLRICHVNLAKGIRGGESQTVLLIKQLAVLGVRQQLVIRYDSPLRDVVTQVPNLKLTLLRKPYFFYILFNMDADLIHAHEARAAQWAYLKTRWSKTPYIITRRILKSPKKNFLTDWVYRSANTVVAVSRAVAENIQKRFAFSDVLVIPDMCSGYQADHKVLLDLKEKYAGKFVVGHIGALVNKDKGQRFLIAAAKSLNEQAPDIQVLLLGVGPDERSLKEQAQGLNNLEFLGFQTDIGAYLSLFDLFVFPSLQEGLGSILLDAMQAGKPIIATKVGGIPDVIEHEHNGLLVCAADADALLKAILRMYSDSELQDRLGAQALDDAKLYQPDCIAKHYYSLYQRLLPQNSPQAS